MVLILGTGVLTTISMIEHRQLQTRFAAVGMSATYHSFALSNVATSLVASIAAYLLGVVIRLVAFA